MNLLAHITPSEGLGAIGLVLVGSILGLAMAWRIVAWWFARNR